MKRNAVVLVAAMAVFLGGCLVTSAKGRLGEQALERACTKMMMAHQPDALSDTLRDDLLYLFLAPR